MLSESVHVSFFQRVAMEKAKSYLVLTLERLQNPYAVAISAYALSVNEPRTSEAQQAHRKLVEMATCDSSYGYRCHGFMTLH